MQVDKESFEKQPSFVQLLRYLIQQLKKKSDFLWKILSRVKQYRLVMGYLFIQETHRKSIYKTHNKSEFCICTCKTPDDDKSHHIKFSFSLVFIAIMLRWTLQIVLCFMSATDYVNTRRQIKSTDVAVHTYHFLI